MRALRIAYVGTLPPHPGGSAVACWRLLAELRDRGAEVRALAPAAPDQVEEHAPEVDGIDVTRYPVPYFAINPQELPDEYRRNEGDQIRARLPRLLDDPRPDLVLVGRESFAWHVPQVARSHGLPCVLMVHGSTTANAVRGVQPHAQALLEEYRKADLIVSPAEHLARDVRSAGLERVAAVPNPVDLARFRPRPKPRHLLSELRIEDDAIVALHASNFKPIKRALDIVDSAERAIERDPRLVYVIVGDGPDLGSVRAASEERRIAHRFRFTGWVANDRVPAYMNLADLVLMPSGYETQALVYLEAQASGCVLVASRVAGSEEVVRHGQTGLLHEVGDIEGLTTATLRVAADSDWRAEIGARARRAVRRHSAKDSAEAFAAALNGVVARAREVAAPRA